MTNRSTVDPEEDFPPEYRTTTGIWGLIVGLITIALVAGLIGMSS